MIERGSNAPSLGVASQSTLKRGLRVHAVVASRHGESLDLARQDAVNAGIKPRALATISESLGHHQNEADLRCSRWRDGAARHLSAWLHYPLWLVATAPALLTLHLGALKLLHPEFTPAVSLPLAVVGWAVFALLVMIRIHGAAMVRSSPRPGRWRRFMRHLPIAGPLMDGLDRATRLRMIGAELRDGLPLELALLRQGETEAAREVSSGEPAHVAVMASEALSSAAPLLESTRGAPLAEAFDRAADGLSERAIDRARAHAMAWIPALILVSAGALFWAASLSLSFGAETIMTHFGGMP